MDANHLYQRNLPHWRQPGSVYFVTWRLHQNQVLLGPPERDLVVEALCHFNQQRYDLLCYVVMDDHVHVLVQPFASMRLQDLTRSWKSYTANRLQRLYGRRGAVWQDESFDRIVRDEKELLEKTVYILSNPQKRWSNGEQYRWVGGAFG